jgi:hypothetical protein
VATTVAAGVSQNPLEFQGEAKLLATFTDTSHYTLVLDAKFTIITYLTSLE